MNGVFIGLGTNLGNLTANLNLAYALIYKNVGRICLKSSHYQTAPWGYHSTSDFLNAVIKVETKLDINTLFIELKKIEHEMGRQANLTAQGYQDRIIDLDILDFNNTVFQSPQLHVPHQKMHLRSFVLLPLAEVAPQWEHPEFKMRAKDLFAALDKTSENENPRKF